MLKTTGLSLLALLAAFASRAQDVITTTNGTTMDVKVDEITPRTVLYHKSDNLTGPQYSIPKKEVATIEYDNGTKEDFGYRRGPDNHGRMEGMRATEDRSYGNNTLSVAPVFINSEGSPGFGVMYERVLDRRGIVSLQLPFALSLVRDYDLNSLNPNTGRYDRIYRPFYHVYPGLKIYPTGSQGVVRYSIGAALDIGFGDKYIERGSYNPITGLYNSGYVQNVFKTGMMINNGLNFMPTKNLYIGMELGLGFYYIDTEDDYYGYNEVPAAQFNFRVGYRF